MLGHGVREAGVINTGDAEKGDFTRRQLERI